eukprot:128691_1
MGSAFGHEDRLITIEDFEYKGVGKRKHIKLHKNNHQANNNINKIMNNVSQIPIQSRQQSVNFKIHIAIDFGTDGCAIAYYYNNKVIIYNKWMTKSRQPTTKVKTQILLNDKDEVVAFGDNAKIIYSSLNGDEKKRW